jgi:acetyl esterase
MQMLHSPLMSHQDSKTAARTHIKRGEYMTRSELYKEIAQLSREELIQKAEEIRSRILKAPLPKQMSEQVHTLDDVTRVTEVYTETQFGRTHFFLIRPAESENRCLPVMVNLHGGGWTLPHGERDIFFCRRIAHRLHMLVVDVDYVLAPVAPYPAALMEIEALLSELPDLLPNWGGDPQKIVLCGQSAGGNLIAAVSERRKYDASRLHVLAQFLCYPPSDNVEDHYHGAELNPTAVRSEYYGFFYNIDEAERKNYDVSLTYSTDEQLRGLIPTEIITGGQDLLTAATERYDHMLREQGVSGKYKCFPESHHGFMVNLYDEYKEAEDYLVERMSSYLA